MPIEKYNQRNGLIKNNIMDRCEHKHKQKRYLTGRTIKIQCKKESVMIDEGGRELCKHHFNKWFKKKYNKDYDTFINDKK